MRHVTSDIGLPNGRFSRKRGAAVLYGVYWLLLAFFVIGFVLKAGPGMQWLLGLLIVVVTLILYARYPMYALCTLPGTLMLGVIARVPLGDAGVHLGDIHLITLGMVFLAAKRPDGRIFVGSIGLAPLAAAVIIVSWLLSIDVAASSITIFGLAELFVVYILTANLVRDDEDAATLLRAWWGAITLCSALVIVSYLRAEPLILNADVSFVSEFERLKLSESVLYRASFFVTTFNFPLACTLVTLLLAVVVGNDSIRFRILGIGALMINIGAVVLLGNKSVIAAAAITSILAVTYLSRRKRFLPALLIGVASFIIVVRVVLVVFRDMVVSPQQLMLLAERLSDQESLVRRLATWKNVVAAVFTSPHALLIGLGPDVSTRSNHQLLSRIFGEEGAVDSDYLFILLNYGAIILLLYLRYLWRALWVLGRRLRGPHGMTCLWLLCCILTWLLVGITQQGGAAKPLALLVQVIALVELLRANRYGADATAMTGSVMPAPAGH